MAQAQLEAKLVEVDGLADIEGCTSASLLETARRVRASSRAEHFVYREAELYELRRLCEAPKSAPDGHTWQSIEAALRSLVGAQDLERAAALLQDAATRRDDKASSA